MGAGDEVGMFPKEESHVRVMIFFLTDICIKINFWKGSNYSSA